MGNRTKRAPGRPKPQSSRPSMFFIIALVLGLAFLVWMLSQTGGSVAPPTTTSQLELSKGTVA